MDKIKIEIKWAVIFAVTTLIWLSFERLIGLHDELIESHALYTNFFALFAIAIYVFALLEKKKKFYGGEMSYKQGFLSGLLLTLFIAILSPLTQYIISTFITPEFFANMIEYSVASGKMKAEDAEKYFSLSGYILQGVIGAFLMGAITSAIVAIFTKSRRPKETAA